MFLLYKTPLYDSLLGQLDVIIITISCCYNLKGPRFFYDIYVLSEIWIAGQKRESRYTMVISHEIVTEQESDSCYGMKMWYCPC